MRIAVLNWSCRKVGGAETYLGHIIPKLLDVGHEVVFWHEGDKPSGYERIPLPGAVSTWCVSDLGVERALAVLRDWKPDLIYSHGLVDLEIEVATLELAPAVFFAHSYTGTCISGAKFFKSPVIKPCNRRFGWQCLFHYYPHRCGGWSPVTMLREYRLQSRRLELLSSYKAIVTLSAHMRSEYIKHRLDPERIFKLPGFTHRTRNGFSGAEGMQSLKALPHPNGDSIPGAGPSTSTSARSYWRLLFMGRMELSKGGQLFLDSLPRVRASLGRPIRVTFVGDGVDRRAWERKAARLQAENQDLLIDFPGWINGSQLDSLFAEHDLLVLPSLWPEPFGMVGLEAGTGGLPVAAFPVGGIPEWLTDGFNGYFAPGETPTATGLAEAIIKCLRDPAIYHRLSRGAMEMARRFEMEHHLKALLKVFENVIRVRKF